MIKGCNNAGLKISNFCEWVKDGTLTLKEFQELQEGSQVGASLESGVFFERLERLEKEVKNNSKTLDRILALLEQQQQKK